MTPSPTFETFGSMLKFLRRRAEITQMELGLAVGYNEAHISRLENGQRKPDLAALAALFVPALNLQDEPKLAADLLELAGRARGKSAAHVEVVASQVDETYDIFGVIESIPLLPPYYVPRTILTGLGELLASQRGLVLCGMAGIGKTTLAASLAHDWAKTRPVFWLTFSPGVTASIDIIIRHLALFALAQGCEQVVPILAQPEVSKPALALDQQLALINLALSDLDALLCFDRVNLVCNDEAILHGLTHLLSTSRVHLLLTSREELPLPEVTQIRLSGMVGEEAFQLLGGLKASLAPDLAAQLIAKTGGSPMLMRLAIGQIREGRDASALVTHLETEPEVALFLLDSVLKSLSPQARRLAELLSVFRQPVNFHDEKLIERADRFLKSRHLNLGQALAELQQRQLIDQPAAAILHPLVRDHIYASLNEDLVQRRALHALAGKWLFDEPDQVLETAYHLGRSHAVKRAVDLLTDQAYALISKSQSENGVLVVDELIGRSRHLPNAKELLRSLLIVRGDLLASTLRVAEADENYREALRLTSQPAVRAHIALQLARSLIARNRAGEALDLCKEIALDLPESTHLLLSAQLANVYSQAYLSLSQLDSALSWAEQALELAGQLQPGMPREAVTVEAYARLVLGVLKNLVGHTQEASREWQLGIVAARAANLKPVEYRCQMNLGILYYQQGNWASALENYKAALLGARASNDSISAARVWSNIAIVRFIRGELDDALAATAEARRLKEQIGDRVGMANADNTRASILLVLENYDQAQIFCESAIAEVQGDNTERLLGGYLDTQAQIQLAQGNASTALATLQQILNFPGACEDASLIVDVRCHLVLAYLAVGQLEAAQSHWISLTRSNDPRQEIEYNLAGGWLGRARGDLPTAKKCLHQARQRMEASGYAVYANSIQRLELAIRNPSLPADLRF